MRKLAKRKKQLFISCYANSTVNLAQLLGGTYANDWCCPKVIFWCLKAFRMPMWPYSFLHYSCSSKPVLQKRDILS